MTQVISLPAERRIPTRKDALLFRLKTLLLQTKRLGIDLLDRDLRTFRPSVEENNRPVIAESRTPLWTEHEPEERVLLAGKIQNLRLASASLQGIEIGAGEIFSFWKQVGRTTRMRGFVEGRELREGCIIPNIGGGLCQLSNALYDAALKANFEIVERHPHTQIVAGSLAEQGRDATVFWNYVDLRFRSPGSFRIEARLENDELLVRFLGEKVTRSNAEELPQIPDLLRRSVEPRSCMSCEVNDCHRVVERTVNVNFGRTAFLVDEYWPEFDGYVQANKDRSDSLFLPIDGIKFRRANYAWSTGGFAKVEQSYYVTAARSYSSRKLAAQGASRQINLLRNYERLAESYAQRLTFDMPHVVVQQDLLPFLWRGGHLGGRTFDVLMTALPMNEIQRRLDIASSLHPESKTLGDFRADRQLLKDENEALRYARKIITVHSAIAGLFGKRSVLLEWEKPVMPNTARRQNAKPIVVFPASTVGRKGCYELRDALKGLAVKIIKLGPNIESDDFWDGFDCELGGNEAVDTADLVVLPAFVEHRPRRLLRAAAAGIPVIASSACGVANVKGFEYVEAGNNSLLTEKITAALSMAIL